MLPCSIQCPKILKLMVCLRPHFLQWNSDRPPKTGMLLTQSCRAVHAMADFMVTCGKFRNQPIFESRGCEFTLIPTLVLPLVVHSLRTGLICLVELGAFFSRIAVTDGAQLQLENGCLKRLRDMELSEVMGVSHRFSSMLLMFFP